MGHFVQASGVLVKHDREFSVSVSAAQSSVITFDPLSGCEVTQLTWIHAGGLSLRQTVKIRSILLIIQSSLCAVQFQPAWRHGVIHLHLVFCFLLWFLVCTLWLSTGVFVTHNTCHYFMMCWSYSKVEKNKCYISDLQVSASMKTCKIHDSTKNTKQVWLVWKCCQEKVYSV